MSQQNVYQCLKKKKRITTKEIANKIGISPSNVTKALRKLIKQGAVMRTYIKNQNRNSTHYYVYWRTR